MDAQAEPRAAAPDASGGSDGSRRDQRAMLGDGVAFSAMIGTGESYVAAFALAVGLGAVSAGLIGTIPMLAGACIQLLTPRASRWLGSYRKWVVACATVQALTFAPLVVAAVRGSISFSSLLLIASAYWAAGMSTAPAWNAWVTSLVPAAIRTRFFARRARWGQTSLLASLVVAGLLLEAGRRFGFEMLAFAGIFSMALVARLVSAGFLSRQTEAYQLPRQHDVLHPIAVVATLRRVGSLGVLGYLVAMQVAVNVASPYFTPYMLAELELSYGAFMLLAAVPFLARVLVLRRLGRLGERHGTRRILYGGALGIIPLPALWLVSDHLAYLLVIQVASGIAWAALELATTLSFFERIADRDRASVLAVFNLANAVAIVLGSLLGGQLLLLFGSSGSGYLMIFLVSSSARLCIIPLLRRTQASHSAEPPVSRTLAVRPAGGIYDRPLLSTLPDDPEAH